MKGLCFYAKDNNTNKCFGAKINRRGNALHPYLNREEALTCAVVIN